MKRHHGFVILQTIVQPFSNLRFDFIGNWCCATTHRVWMGKERSLRINLRVWPVSGVLGTIINNRGSQNKFTACSFYGHRNKKIIKKANKKYLADFKNMHLKIKHDKARTQLSMVGTTLINHVELIKLNLVA